MHLQAVILLFVTAVCAITDARYGKVYNVVTYPSALAGVGLSFFFAPPAPLTSILGLLAGLTVFGLLRKVSGMGAGDVKLMAAVGALKGLPFLVYSTFYILCAASVTALILIAWQGRLVPVLKWVASTLVSVVSPKYSPPNRNHEMTPMPFAPAIFIGSAFSVYLETVHGYFSF